MKNQNIFPENVEAEQYLLGSILLNNEVFFFIEGFLDSSHFSHLLHIKIYDSIGKLFKKSLPISIATVTNLLQEDKEFIENNAQEYLMHLSALATSVVNPKSYAEIIYNLHLKRSLINIGSELIHNVGSSDLTTLALEHVSETESKLFQLVSTGSHKEEFVNIASHIQSSVNTIDIARKAGKGITGISTGFTDLDKKLSGFHNSDLVIIAGRPSMGKTALALNIALKIATNTSNDSKTPIIGFFSLEMSSDQLAMRMIAIESGINAMHLREGKVKEEDYNKLRDHSYKLSQMPLFIDDSPALSINSIASRARRLKRQHGLDIIFIDYLQLIRANSRFDNRVLEISEITQGLKAIAKELNIPVIVMSQLSRGVEQRQDKRPVLSDLRDSGTIEQDADVVMFIYREEYYLSRSVPELGTKEYEEWQNKMANVSNVSELHVAKHRNGPIGQVYLFYDNNLAKFDNNNHIW